MSVHLTERTLQDLVSIEEYSIENWGKRIANRYLDDIEAALQRISDNPDVLREEPNFHNCLYVYRVNKHLLVCDVQTDLIFVLTILHGNMDIPERLAELEPTLKLEVELLHKQLGRGTKKAL
jgi:toxin ParE1/3/4